MCYTKFLQASTETYHWNVWKDADIIYIQLNEIPWTYPKDSSIPTESYNKVNICVQEQSFLVCN